MSFNIAYSDKDKIKKIERFNKISQEASKQCGRSDRYRPAAPVRCLTAQHAKLNS